MTGTAPRLATPNAGDGKTVSENGQRVIANGRIGLFGRAIRPARRIPRGSEADIAWKVTFQGRTLAGGKPNGECQVIADSIVSVIAAQPAMQRIRRIRAYS